TTSCGPSTIRTNPAPRRWPSWIRRRSRTKTRRSFTTRTPSGSSTSSRPDHGRGAVPPAPGEVSLEDGVIPKQRVIRWILRLQLRAPLPYTHDHRPVEPLMRPDRGAKVRRAPEVTGNSRSLTFGLSRRSQRAMDIPQVANVDARAVVRLDHVMRVELHHAVLPHDRPVGAAVIVDLAIQSRAADRAAFSNRRVADVGTARDGPNQPALVEVDPNIEDVREPQIQRGLGRRI